MATVRFITDLRAVCAADCEHAGEPCQLPRATHSAADLRVFSMLRMEHGDHSIRFVGIGNVTRVIGMTDELRKDFGQIASQRIVATNDVCGGECTGIRIDLITRKLLVPLCGAPVCHKRYLAFDVKKSSLAENGTNALARNERPAQVISHASECEHHGEEIPLPECSPQHVDLLQEMSAQIRKMQPYANTTWSFIMPAKLEGALLPTNMARGDAFMLVQTRRCEFCRGYCAQYVQLYTDKADKNSVFISDNCCIFHCEHGGVAIAMSPQCKSAEHAAHKQAIELAEKEKEAAAARGASDSNAKGPAAAAAAAAATPAAPSRREKECCVCMEEITEDFIVLLPCGHSNLCKPCALQLKRTHKTCPMCCRTIKKVSKLFLE